MCAQRKGKCDLLCLHSEYRRKQERRKRDLEQGDNLKGLFPRKGWSYPQTDMKEYYDWKQNLTITPTQQKYQ